MRFPARVLLIEILDIECVLYFLSQQIDASLTIQNGRFIRANRGKFKLPLLRQIQDGGFIRSFLFEIWTPVTWSSTHSRSNISMVLLRPEIIHGDLRVNPLGLVQTMLFSCAELNANEPK